jgi:branched-chain amino acid transport system ATP-binding protein
MSEVLLRVDDLVKNYGSIRATDHLSLTVEQGELHAIIGPNGAGKTTMVSQLCGELKSDAGRIMFDGADITGVDFPGRARIGIARSFQITSLCNAFTAVQNIALAVQARSGSSVRFWRKAWDDTQIMGSAESFLHVVGLGPVGHVPAGQLSHGQRRQLELGIALASKPRMLMLDEPLAGMSREDASEMIHLIERLKRQYTILLIEHDMDAVFRMADRISVLVYGRCIATGTPDMIGKDAEVRRAYLGEGKRHAAH